MNGSPFDTDPAALAWARDRVLQVTAQWRAEATVLAGHGLDMNAEKWRRIAQITENALIGGKTDTLGAFDHRHAAVPDGIWGVGGACATCGKPVPGGGHQDGCTGLVPGSEYRSRGKPMADNGTLPERLLDQLLTTIPLCPVELELHTGSDRGSPGEVTSEKRERLEARTASGVAELESSR